jgi:hypothetical protein
VCEGGEVYTRFWWGSLREGDHLKDTSVDGRMILKWILEKLFQGYGLDRPGSGQGQVAGSCECGNERLGYIKRGENLE